MTREDIVSALSAIERTLDNRVTVVRVIIDENFNELGRIVRGTFLRQQGEPHDLQIRIQNRPR
jgi:hypothetical protein